MVKKTSPNPVQWLSEKAEWQQSTDPEFTYKIVDFYSKFRFKNIEAAVGDYILISNADAAEPDTVEGCDVAQIIKLYESHDQVLEDRFRAHVQWFCRSSDVPSNCLKNTDISLDEEIEVVEDHRPYDKDVSIETFFKKCEIKKLTTTAAVSQMPRNPNSKTPTFVCRFQLVPLARKKYNLQPILEEERLEYSSNFTGLLKTSKPKKGKDYLSASKIPNTLVKKMAASNLNEERNWTIKNSDSSKIVLMRDITNAMSLSGKKSASNGTNKRKSVLNNDDVSPNKLSNRNNIQKCSDNDISRLLASDEESDIQTIPSPNKKDHNKNKKKSHKNVQTKSSDLKENKDDTPKCKTSTRVSKQNSKCVDKKISTSNMTPKVTSKSHNTPKRARPPKNPTDSDSEYEFQLKTPKKIKATSKAVKTPVSRKIKTSDLTPSIHARHNPVMVKEGGLQQARESLHVSAVPLSLPCREVEFNDIYTFIEGKISDNSGGCMYISGVPGTGKTATVTEVVRCLKKQVKLHELPKFEFIEINGMRLTEPRQAYVHIYRQLTGKTVSWEQACNLLEARFTKPAPRRSTIVLLIDELDVLCNRRQDVLYNLLEWPAHSAAQLVVVAIANTMDLPERLLMGRVASRLGLTRLTFQPYTYTQLQSIVTARLADTGAFNSDAVQLVARKVAAVSGDARRALDICRRAVELAERGTGSQVGLGHVNQALSEMIASPKVQAIKTCSKMEQFFLQAAAAEVQRTGIEETTFQMIYKQLETICAFGGLKTPSVTESFGICCRLGSYRLIITEHSRNDIYQKVILNVSSDDVHYATQNLSVF